MGQGGALVERVHGEAGHLLVLLARSLRAPRARRRRAMRSKPPGARGPRPASCTPRGPARRLASTIADVAGRRTASYRERATARSALERKQPASTRASRIACDAPFDPIGYIGCAASPSSVTAAEAPARQRIAIDHRVHEDRLGARGQRRHVEPVETPALERGQELLELGRACSSLRARSSAMSVETQLGDPVDA